MRIAHKVGVTLIAIALMLLLLLVPRHGHSETDVSDLVVNRDSVFGDYVVRCSAISTDQIADSVARQYGIERSARRGLLNVSVELKTADATHTTHADVSAEVSDLIGHRTPIRVRETNENGDIDYLADFPLTGSGTYVFTVKVTPQGQAQPYVVKFNQDYVVD
jgi:hypothetical protein